MTEELFANLESLFDVADKIWEDYTAQVKQSLLNWEKLRPLLLEKITILKTRISSNLKELEEIQLKVELGLLEEEKSQKKFNSLSEETISLIHELETLVILFEKTTLKSIQHMKRIGIPLDITPEDIQRKIDETDHSFREGIISSEDIYKELKHILEDQLQLVSNKEISGSAPQ